jgi:hypothetical protein
MEIRQNDHYRRGLFLACVAFAIPFLLALVHVPTHIGSQTTCCETHVGEYPETELANAETSCPICRQLSEFLCQNYVPASAVIVCKTPAILATPAFSIEETPRISIPDRIGWARPPPA